jgi:predicted XRE-type DNA-binding protein
MSGKPMKRAESMDRGTMRPEYRRENLGKGVRGKYYKQYMKGANSVYVDLGRADAAEMLLKAELVTKINDIIKRRRLTQAAAAEILGIPQPKLSKMLRGEFRRISEDRMMRCLVALGHDVRILVKPARKGRGSLTVATGT